MKNQKVLTVLSAEKTGSRQLFYILAGSFIVALFANFTIRLPFTPVPIVLQNILVLALGIILGPRIGTLSVLAFLIQGGAGLPVFANMEGGYAVFLGPKGGYLLGYLIGAYVAGKVSLLNHPYRVALALVAGVACQYALGLIQLGVFVGYSKTLALGFYPFIVGDLLKITVVSQLIRFYYSKSARTSI